VRHVRLPVDELTHKVTFLVSLLLWRVLACLGVQFWWLARSFHHAGGWLLGLSLSHYCDSNLVLAFSFSRRPRVNNLHLVSVGVCWLLVHFVLRNHAWWLHVEMARFILVLAVIVNTWLIKVLVEILNWVVHIRVRIFWSNSAHSHLPGVLQLCLPARNALVVILVEQLDKSVIWHIFTSLNKAFSLQFNVWLLR